MNDANGMGWVAGIAPTVYAYAGGVAGYSDNSNINVTSEQIEAQGKTKVRHYAPQYAAGANYASSSKSSDKNIVSQWKETYCTSA